jgi:site-specific recombinase XerD
MAWEITRDKFFSKEERNRLVKATEEKAIVDLTKSRSTWVKRWMLVDLALFSGLRVSEIANLKIGDLHLNRMEKLIHVRNGKGGKSGYVTIDSDLAKHLKEYMAWKKTIEESIDPEAPLLTGSKKGKPYSTMGLQKQFKEAIRNAGLSNHYSIHSCRHTFATYLLASTKNLRLVQKQLRHSSPSVTAVYADVTPEDMTEAMEGLRNNGNGHTCRLCRNKITKPAKQLHIDGTSVDVCPVCCEKILG